jgi:hypothetical protein
MANYELYEITEEINKSFNNGIIEEKLNDDWIKNFENTDELYKDFYKEDLYFINLNFIYLNRANEIEKIKNEPFLMSKPNYISREEILGILKKSLIEDNRNYSLLSILRYNILLEPDDINNLLNESRDLNFLTIIKNIDAISFEQTIHMFQDLNDIFFIFFEKSNELKKNDMKNATKKIYLHSLNANKKTIKKQYKD